MLGDGVHVDGAQQRAVCSVEATIDPDGSTRAGGVVPNPDGTMCPYALHDAAVAAVGRSEWPPLDQPARTVLPVFFVPTP